MQRNVCVVFAGLVMIVSQGLAAKVTAAEGITVDNLQGVYAAPLTPAAKACVNQLTNGLAKLYGKKLGVLANLPADEPVILLGKQAALESGLITQADIAKVTPGGYVIRTARNRVAIAGPTIHCTGYGVTAFLEALGLRQYCQGRHGSQRVTHVDKPGAKTLPAINKSSKPAIIYRTYATRNEWALADKALITLHPELKGKTDLWIDHSAGFLLPKDIYYDAHPEYYAMLKNGKRAPKTSFTYHRTPLCLSNPDVTKISIERALKWVALQPDKTFFPITYGDSGVWCQCEACKKLDPEPGAYATRLLTWVNAVARAIGEKYPDKIIITFAYGGSDKPPPKIRPEKNVWMCLSTSLGGIPFFDHRLAKPDKGVKNAIAKIEGWNRIAPGQVTVCEYQSGVYNPVVVDKMAARYRYYAKHGVRGVIFTFGHPTNMTPLWTYLYPRLMWNPQQDAQALAADFARHYYGAADAGMAEYLRVCHASYQETLQAGAKLKDGYPEGFYSEAFTQKALAAFDKARAAAKDTRLLAEVKAENRLFIMDWMRQPVSTAFDDAAKKTLVRQLDSLAALVDNTEKDKIAFAREVHKVGLGAEAKQKGALAVVEAWLKAQDFPKPKAIKIKNGVRLPAEVFMYAGWGPRTYKGGHVLDPCPPKTAVAVYVKDNSARRSHHMEAQFDLDTIQGDGAAVLDIEGQDSDHPVDTSAIRIEINGQKIFEGQVQAVKGNWSRQSFAVPPGLLKVGTNKLEIINAVDPKTVKNWFERWFMLSDATITFTG